MASDRAAVAWAGWDGWSPGGGQPSFRAWSAVGAALGHALAGHAGALWQVQDDAQTLHPLGGDRGLDRVFADLLKDRDNRYVMIDSSVVRAHQQAAAARKKGLRRALWGGVEEV